MGGGGESSKRKKRKKKESGACPVLFDNDMEWWGGEKVTTHWMFIPLPLLYRIVHFGVGLWTFRYLLELPVVVLLNHCRMAVASSTL